MKKQKTKSIFKAYLFLIFFPLLLTSCGNLFEWANPSFSGSNAEGLVDRGDQYYDNQNYEEAMEAYAQALEIDPYNDTARLGYARAVFAGFLPEFTSVAIQSIYEDGFTNAITNTNDTTNTNTNSTSSISEQIAALSSNDVVQIIVAIIQDPDAVAALMSPNNIRYYREIIDVLDSPYGVVNGAGDGSVSPESLEVNLLLLISYFCDTVFDLLDSNGDGVFMGDGDFILLGTNDLLELYVDPDSALANFEEIFAMFSSDTNDTNTNTMSGDEVLQILESTHDNIEDVLLLLQFADEKLIHVDDIIGALIRPSAYWETFGNVGYFAESWSNFTTDLEYGLYANAHEMLLDAYTNSNSISSFSAYLMQASMIEYMAEDFGGILNEFHKLCVGDPAYSGSISLFAPTSWDTHSGGLKGASGTLDSIFSILSNSDSLTNDDVLSNLMSNANILVDVMTNSFTPDELVDILEEYGSMLGMDEESIAGINDILEAFSDPDALMELMGAGDTN